MRMTISLLYGIVSTLSITVQALLYVKHFKSVRVGQYVALNCKSNNQHLSSVLLHLQDALKPVLTDLDSKRSSTAYWTFFKDITYAPYVRSVLSDVVGGVAISVEHESTPQTPRFVCVDGPGQVIWDEGQARTDAYDQCTSCDPVAAAILLPGPYIFLCPHFFEWPTVPAVAKTSCLSLDPERPYLFAYGDMKLLAYQMWALLHELVHFYVYATKHTHKDFYDVNECAYLSGKTAILNAQSYLYYAANILLGCTVFPRLNTRIGVQGDELLEIWDNETGAAVNDSIAFVAQNVSVIAAPPVETPEPAVDPKITSQGMGKRRRVYSL